MKKLLVVLILSASCYGCEEILLNSRQDGVYSSTPTSSVSSATSVGSTSPTRDLFYYRSTFEPYENTASVYPNVGNEEKIRFDFLVSRKEHNLKFRVAYVLQHRFAKKDAYPWFDGETTSVKSIEIQEMPDSDRSCNKIKVELSGPRTLRMRCKDVLGLTEDTYFIELSESPKTTSSGCSTVKHL